MRAKIDLKSMGKCLSNKTDTTNSVLQSLSGFSHWWHTVIGIATSAVDSWFEPSRVKPKTMECVFVVSPPRPVGSHEE